MENINDLGSEYNVLNSAGIQCVAHSLSGDFHHKYGIFDVNDTDPQVVTGSHNWSFSAEAFNDENTVVIHDYRVASLFSSEFWQRWQELTVPVYSPDIQYLQVWPNPVADRIFFGAGSTGVSGYVVIRDALGITRLEQEANSSLDVSHLPAGIYFFTIQTDDGVGTVPFQKL